jgi:hypothetical protein
LSAFNPTRIRANPLVADFYSKIPTPESIDYTSKTTNIFQSFVLEPEEYVDPTIKRVKL